MPTEVGFRFWVRDASVCDDGNDAQSDHSEDTIGDQ